MLLLVAIALKSWIAVREVILDIAIVVAYFGVLVALGFIVMSRARSMKELYVCVMRIGRLLAALSFFTTYFSSVIFVGATAIGWKYCLLVLWKDVFVVWIGTFLAFVLLGPRLKVVTVRFKVQLLKYLRRGLVLGLLL